MLCTLIINDNKTREILYEPTRVKDREFHVLNLSPLEVEKIKKASHDKIQDILSELY